MSSAVARPGVARITCDGRTSAISTRNSTQDTLFQDSTPATHDVEKLLDTMSTSSTARNSTASIQKSIRETVDSALVQKAVRQVRLPPIKGTKLWLLVFVLFVALLLSTLEQLIVGTALNNIASDLGDYDKSSWVVTAYLMSYNGFLIVFARASDIFGRPSVFLVALLIFTIASPPCGLAQTMNQLIVFRSFQGIGGAGLVTLTLNVSTEIPGKAKTIISVLIPAAFGSAAGAAPVIGGAIVDNATWRWVFLLDATSGAILAVIAFIVFPKNAVPLHIKPRDLLRIDWPGVALLLGGLIMLNFAFQEATTQYMWTDAPIIGTLVGAGVCWIAFFSWESFLTSRESKSIMLPLWPARLFKGRVVLCAMITAFLSGFPLYSIYIYLPQRFELVNGLTPLMSGIHLLVVPIVAFWATGIASSTCLFKNLSYPYLVGALGIQAIGLGLLSIVPSTQAIPAALYGYEILIGLGIGVALPTVSIIARAEAGHLDHSVNMSAVSALRSLGGAISVSIGNIIINTGVVNKLVDDLREQQLLTVTSTPNDLVGFSPSQVTLVRRTFGDAFALNTKISMVVCIAAFVVSLGCFVRHPVNLSEVDERETKAKAEQDEQANPAKGGTEVIWDASSIEELSLPVPCAFPALGSLMHDEDLSRFFCDTAGD